MEPWECRESCDPACDLCDVVDVGSQSAFFFFENGPKKKIQKKNPDFFELSTCITVCSCATMEAPGSQDGSTPLAVVNVSDVPPGLQQMQLAAQNTMVTSFSAKNVEETELVVLSRGPNTTKWQCPHCKNTSSGAPERMRKHLTGEGTGAGVLCTAMSRSEIARIAKKFVEHDETTKGKKSFRQLTCGAENKADPDCPNDWGPI